MGEGHPFAGDAERLRRWNTSGRNEDLFEHWRLSAQAIAKVNLRCWHDLTPRQRRVVEFLVQRPRGFTEKRERLTTLATGQEPNNETRSEIRDLLRRGILGTSGRPGSQKAELRLANVPAGTPWVLKRHRDWSKG